MAVQTSSQNNDLLNEATAVSTAVGGEATYNVSGQVTIPPRPTWFKAKSRVDSQANKKLIDTQEFKNLIDKPDRNMLKLLWLMIIEPVKYIPQLSGLGVSLAVHGFFLLTMALYTFGSGTLQQGMITLMSGEAGDDMAMTRIDTTVATDVAPAPMIETSISMPVAENTQLVETNFGNESMEKIEASLARQMESESNPFTGAFAPPAGSNVVKQGSFAAYTVPNDPIPEQTYYVVILIKVPKGTDKYPVTDLSGNITGTDGWEQPIVDKLFMQRTKHLEVKDQVAQLIVQVPGAYKLVKDKITIKSKLLRENQRLEIEF
jgi:hypothetical protein